MPSTDNQALEQMLRTRPKPLETTERRKIYDSLGEKFPLAADARAEALMLGGVPAEATTTPATQGAGTILYLHGGGYVYGSLHSHRHLASELGRAARAKSIALDYRRAPEAPFPAALDDALSAWQALLKLGTKAKDIAVVGDSAGGGLAVSLMVHLREMGLDQPACAVLLSPWTDMLAKGESYARNAERDPVVGREIIEFCARQYIGEALNDDPLASPVRADLSGIAPLTIYVGSTEALLDDSVQLARAAGLADVKVHLEIWPGMFHIWPNYHPVLPEGRQAVAEIGAVIRAAFDAN
ncbi:alpha/beta hydrolase [Ramlibacter sp.]|uniref:alpha/beta hydrolase n=1 Tax=Ramlibacter sp. TaxID=1917967 RepID=UPI003D0EDF67